jgi:hypothetical protein
MKRLGVVAWWVAVAVGAAAQAPETSVKAIADAAAAYLAGYEKQASFLLSDETYTQRVLGPSGQEIDRRTMMSESFVTFVPSSRVWISVRDVMTVDGKPVDHREDVRSLLQNRDAFGLARTIAERNARFNIGSISRNFNEPTLGLLVLEPERRPQFRFERKAVTADAGVTLVTLAFKEVDLPTLIHGVTGPPVFSTGELVVEAGTGRIRQTVVNLKHDRIAAQLSTQYAHDPKLDMWVPATFTERYERTRGAHEVIVCEAAYTNYRRFDATSRIRLRE